MSTRNKEMELAQMLSVIMSVVMAIISAWYAWSRKHRQLEARIENWQAACRDRDDMLNALKTELCVVQHKCDTTFQTIQAEVQRTHDFQVQEAAKKYAVIDYYEVGNDIRVEFVDRNGRKQNRWLRDYVTEVQDVVLQTNERSIFVEFTSAHGHRVTLPHEDYVRYAKENAKDYLPPKEFTRSYNERKELIGRGYLKPRSEEGGGGGDGTCVTPEEYRRANALAIRYEDGTTITRGNTENAFGIYLHDKKKEPISDSEAIESFTSATVTAVEQIEKSHYPQIHSDLADQVMYEAKLDAEASEEARRAVPPNDYVAGSHSWNEDQPPCPFENGLMVKFVDYVPKETK